MAFFRCIIMIHSFRFKIYHFATIIISAKSLNYLLNGCFKRDYEDRIIDVPISLNK